MATDRVAVLRNWMEREHVSACILAAPANQYYVTGFRAIIYSRLILTVITADRVALLVPALEESHAHRLGRVDSVLVYREDRGSAHPASLLRELVQGDRQRPRLGIEVGALAVGVLEHLGGLSAEVVDVGPKLMQMRAVKDETELGYIRQAGRYVSLAVEHTKQALGAGKTELEVETEGTLGACRAMREPLAEGYEFMTLTASGVDRTTLPHANTCNRTLTSGEILIHRRHVGVKGYYAECERTFFIGQPSAEQSRLFGIMRLAQTAAIEAVRPGISVAVVDQAARSVYDSAGLLPYVVHRTGHGLGLDHHEAPFLRCDDESTLLAPGMVFSVEPGVYVPGVGGFRHSDTVLVTPSGAEILTSGGKQLQDCIVPDRE